MEISNPAAALGQQVGQFFEDELVRSLRPLIEDHGYSIGPEKLRNGTGNMYQIDAVIRDSEGMPVILIDPKYIRYTKHNRDKGSWLCTAHYNLRKTYPSIRKTIAVLAGRWSETSLALIRSFGVEVVLLDFDHLVSALKGSGIEFEWGEKDRDTPRQSLEKFTNLTMPDRAALAQNLVSPILDRLKDSVRSVIETDLAVTERRISSVEVLLKTDQNEMLLLQYASVSEAIRGMTSYVSDEQNVQGKGFRTKKDTS